MVGRLAALAVLVMCVTSCGADDSGTPVLAPPTASRSAVAATTPPPTPADHSENAPETTGRAEPIGTETVVESSEPAATVTTTTWVPPAISWPTTPYTLPPDYGQGPPETRPEAIPRATYAPDAVLPPISLIIDDTLTVHFTPPADFRQSPRPLYAISEFDRANGLYALERWAVLDQPVFAGLSIQANPGESSPLLSRQEFSETIPTEDLTWYLFSGMAVRQTGLTPNMGLAVRGDYLFMVYGTPSAMRAIIEALSIDT
jgi:hypothetical protein